MANEIQTLTFNHTPTGGTWSLTFDGDTASGLAFDIDAATLQGQLEALGSVGGGNVAVSGDVAGGFTVEFQGALADTNVPQLTVDATGLTRGATTVAVTVLTPGVAGVQEVQVISFDHAPAAGTLHINGQTVDDRRRPSDLEFSIEQGSGANAPCSVTGTDDTGPFTVTYDSMITVSDTLLNFSGTTLTWEDHPGLSIFQLQPGSGSTNEIRRLLTPADKGSFTLTITDPTPVVGGPVTTGTIDFNDSAGTIEGIINAALAASANPTATVSCSGTLAGDLDVEFTGALALTPIAEMTWTEVTPLNLTTAVVVSVNTTTQGVAPVHEVQRLALTDSPTGGSWLPAFPDFNFPSSGSTSVNFDGTNAAVETALEADLALGFSVTGDYTTHFDVTWDTAGDRDELTPEGSNLTRNDITITPDTEQEGGVSASVLDADAGSFAMTGQNALLRCARKLGAAEGSFVEAGQAAGLVAGRKLHASAGSFAIAGQDATFVYASAGKKVSRLSLGLGIGL